MADTSATTDYSWTEPISDYNTVYPYNNAMQTESGHFQEFDDTPGAERIRTQHRTGTFTEIQADGSEVHKVVGKHYHIVASDNNVLISGICNITIEGDSVLDVQGNVFQNVQGNFNQVVNGDYNLLVKGQTTINSGKDFNIGALAQGTGAVYIQASDRLVLNSDLTVHGEVIADSLYSDSSVVAATGIQAGLPGSTNPVAGISTLGGINVGFPGQTVPGVVNAMTLVTAPIVTGTTMTYGGLLLDAFGGVPMVRILFDAHDHIGNLGRPTSSPIPIMP
jgi:hypothetical protein